MYARGGPTNIDTSVDLSSYLDRSEADVRGVKIVRGAVTPSVFTSVDSSPFASPGPRPRAGNAALHKNMDVVRFEESHFHLMPACLLVLRAVLEAHKLTHMIEWRCRCAAVQGQGEPVTDEEVLTTFMAFSNFGAGAQSPVKTGMDGARFAKLCRETGLQAGKLNSISVDIIFSKIKVKVSILLRQ